MKYESLLLRRLSTSTGANVVEKVPKMMTRKTRLPRKMAPRLLLVPQRLLLMGAMVGSILLRTWWAAPPLLHPPPSWVATTNHRVVVSSNTMTTTSTGSTNRSKNNNDPSLYIAPRQPTHSACDNYDGILHIQSGDLGGAFAAVYFQFIASQILYAERHNLKPFVYLNNVSAYVYDEQVHNNAAGISFTAKVGRKPSVIKTCPLYRKASQLGPPIVVDSSIPETTKKLYFTGTGAFEHYFDPVSDFVPGDRSCEQKSYVTIEESEIGRELHVNSKWALITWRYAKLQDYIVQPHVPYNEWSENQRRKGASVIAKYFRLRPYIQEWAERVNPDCSMENSCLGLHIRHTDKASNRRVLGIDEFLPFAQAFVANGGKHIYLATDSTLVMESIQAKWPESVRMKIRSMGGIVRSSSEKAVFQIANHHRTNQEILVEILSLSHCQFLINGHSAVTEASVWLNFDLHFRSVNLEDPDHLSPQSFGLLVHNVLQGEPQKSWPQPWRTDHWWEGQSNSGSLEASPTETACDGFVGVLHISRVARDASMGSAFFTSILNQMIYADMHNLIPFIHLTEEAELVYDRKEHKTNATKSFEMMGGAVFGENSSSQKHRRGLYRGGGSATNVDRPALHNLFAERFTLSGSGVWNSYFLPVSDFIPGDSSCLDKPFINMDEPLLKQLLQAPSSIQGRHKYTTISNTVVESKRQRAHEIVSKYYKIQPHITRKVYEINPAHEPCLAVHISGSTQESTPSILLQYIQYIKAFERAGGKYMFFASDNGPTINYVLDSIPSHLADRIASQGRHVARTTDHEWPIHFYDDNHRLNSEALVDILALSKCQMMVHGSSMVAEAAIYFNPALHNNSVNLDTDTRSPRQFETLTRETLRTQKNVISETPIANSLREKLPKPKTMYQRLHHFIRCRKYDPFGNSPCTSFWDTWRMLQE